MVKTNSLSKKIKKCDIMDDKLRREFISFLSQRESDKKINSLIDEAISRQIPSSELKEMLQEQELYMEYLGELQRKTGHDIIDGNKRGKKNLNNNSSGKYRTMDRGTSKDRSLKSVSDNSAGKYRTLDRGTSFNQLRIKAMKNNSIGKKFVDKERKNLSTSENNKIEDMKPNNKDLKKKEVSKNMFSFEEIKNEDKQVEQKKISEEKKQIIEKNISKLKNKNSNNKNLGNQESETILNNILNSNKKKENNIEIQKTPIENNNSSTKYTSLGKTKLQPESIEIKKKSKLKNEDLELNKPAEEMSFTKKITSLFSKNLKSKKKNVINKKIKKDKLYNNNRNLNQESNQNLNQHSNQNFNQESKQNLNQKLNQESNQNLNQESNQNLNLDSNQNLNQNLNQNIIKKNVIHRGEELFSEQESISEEEEIKIIKKEMPKFNDVAYFSINEEEINFYDKEKKHINIIRQNERNINLDNLSEPTKIKFFSVLEKIPHKVRPVSMKTNKSIYLEKNLKRYRDFIHLDKNGERKEKIMDIIKPKKKRGMRNNYQFHKLPLFSHKDTSYNPKIENSSEFKNDEKYHKIPKLSLKDTSGIITKKIKKNNLEKKILKKTQKNNYKFHKLR